MRVSFNWLKEYVDIRITPEVLAEKLTMAGLEVTSLARLDHDVILDIEITPNRTDCLSIIGIAREVAAISAKKLKLPKISSFRGKSSVRLNIQIQDKSLCPRYIGRVIKNVKIGPSPEWLIQRLEAMGIRAVNNIVDITNFCLLEFGQPLHAFDLDKLQGQRIIIRKAQEGEQIVTIDGVKRAIDPTMLIIADKFNPQALAGIMGAKDTEVTEATTNILLESAYFNPINIHKTSRKLGLATQSSYRFERGVDLDGVYLASLRATELIQKLARPARKAFSRRARPSKQKSKKLVIGRVINKGKKISRHNRVQIRFVQVSQTLGVEIASAQIKDILRKLEFTIVHRSKEGATINIPTFRPDVTREADLIEEVARLYGYDKIPLRLSQLSPNLSYAGKLSLASEEIYNKVRLALAAQGLSEIMSYSLISRQALRKLEMPFENIIMVKNPLSYEQEIMRPTLLVGMLNTLLVNMNRKNMNLKLFELSRIYVRPQTNASKKEFTNLCVAIAGKKSGNWMRSPSEYSFFDLKGIVVTLLDRLGVEDVNFSEAEYPCFMAGRCAQLFLGKDGFGFLGEIKKEISERFGISYPVYTCELEMHKLLKAVRPEKRFMPLARFPSVERDISLLAPEEINSEQIVALINRIGRELIAKITLFDQYFGEQIPSGFRGLAYSVEYRSKEKTLTAEEADKLHGQIRQALIEELKVQIR